MRKPDLYLTSGEQKIKITFIAFAMSVVRSKLSGADKRKRTKIEATFSQDINRDDPFTVGRRTKTKKYCA